MFETDDTTLQDITWNNSTKRYYFNDFGRKRLISAKAVEKLTELHILDSTNKLTRVAKDLLDQKIGLLSWQLESKQILKELHLANMLLARGGKRHTTATDYLEVGRILKVEYKYFRAFAEDVNRGYALNDSGQKVYITKARFLDRVKKYAQSSRVSFEKGIEANKKETGFTLAQRFLNSKIPCATCPQYAALGKVAIGRVPLPGQKCECGSRCRCDIKYFKPVSKSS